MVRAGAVGKGHQDRPGEPVDEHEDPAQMTKPATPAPRRPGSARTPSRTEGLPDDQAQQQDHHQGDDRVDDRFDAEPAHWPPFRGL
jgi:hypothetical protein